jgi:nucleoside-diphosphate-sugar epimerase
VRIMITGCDGYLGSLLAPLLMEQGHDIIGVDTGYYRAGVMYHSGDPSPLTRHIDVRLLDGAAFDGLDAVVHMAELSNDPLGELAPEAIYDINHAGSVRLARLAKLAGVHRFVYMSSCSVYGVATEDAVTERSATNPQTAYAECKVLVERDVTAMADDDFSPTFLRNATAFGASPRMRFDLVLNNLAGLAWTTRRIAMTSDGTPWRPLVHALDIAQAISCVVAAPRDAVHAETFNIGDGNQNYQVRDIATAVAAAFPGCETTFGDLGGDTRSYRVSFDKVHKHLPSFQCKWTAHDGALQLKHIFERIQLSPDEFEAAPYTRLRQLRRLLSTGQLDTSLYWRHP